MHVNITNAVSSPSPIESPDSAKAAHASDKGRATDRTDSVNISSAALDAAKAAVQEATETPAQTAREAKAGDRQAQRLLAREQAEAAQAQASAVK